VSRFHNNFSSQHYPIITKLSKGPVLSRFNIASRWIFNEDNWKPRAFKLGSMVPDLISDIDDLNDNINKASLMLQIFILDSKNN